MENVDDILPLSPLQQLMLIDARTPDGALRYDLLGFTMRGALDTEKFNCAWRELIRRHAGLRTAFFWEGLDEPVQLVRNDVAFSLIEENLSDDNPDAQLQRLKTVSDDLGAGLSLTDAPPVRVAAVRLGPDAWRILIAYLPCALDGWSVALIIRDLFTIYESQRSGEKTSDAVIAPFRDYIAWLKSQDTEQSISFWRQKLDGVHGPTALPTDHEPPARLRMDKPASVEQTLSPDEVAALRKLAGAARATPNAIIQAAWTLTLAGLADARDVIFGTAVSGRPDALPDADDMIGVFFNNIPIRARFTDTEEAGDLARRIQALLSRARAHQHVSPSEIHAAAHIRSGALYHSLLLFHNFPLKGTFWDQGRSFSVEDIEKPIRTNLPLALICVPELGYKFELVYTPELWTKGGAEKILDDFRRLLRQWLAAPHATCGQLREGVASIGGAFFLADANPSREISAGGAPPATEMEKRIQAIWSQILGVKIFGRDDNFFDLGGRSVHALQICAALQELGAGPLSIVEFFEYPTVAQLAARLTRPADASAVGSRQDDAPARAEARKAARAGRRRRTARDPQSHDE